MKSEFKKIDNDITGIVSNIPADKLKEIYFNRYKDALKALWMNQDESRFNKQMDDLYDFMERMTYQQRLACIDKESEAYNNTLYDLRVMLRSENLEFLGVVLAMYWLIGSVQEHLQAYQECGLDYDLEYAIGICNDLNDTFKAKYWNDDTMMSMESFLESLKDAPELTEQDMEFIDSLAEYPKRYNAMKSVGLE